MARLLVVDDSGYARRVHRQILESAGHVVLEASSGFAALERFSIDQPEAVLLDLSMEDIGGLDVLRRLREMDVGARVLVISADVQQSTERMVRSSGAMGFVGKPAAPDALLAAIEQMLARPST